MAHLPHTHPPLLAGPPVGAHLAQLEAAHAPNGRLFPQSSAVLLQGPLSVPAETLLALSKLLQQGRRAPLTWEQQSTERRGLAWPG